MKPAHFSPKAIHILYSVKFIFATDHWLLFAWFDNCEKTNCQWLYWITEVSSRKKQLVRFLSNRRELLKTNIHWQCNEIFQFSIVIWFFSHFEWWDCLEMPPNTIQSVLLWHILWCYDISNQKLEQLKWCEIQSQATFIVIHLYSP